MEKFEFISLLELLSDKTRKNSVFAKVGEWLSTSVVAGVEIYAALNNEGNGEAIFFTVGGIYARETGGAEVSFQCVNSIASYYVIGDLLAEWAEENNSELATLCFITMQNEAWNVRGNRL